MSRNLSLQNKRTISISTLIILLIGLFIISIFIGTPSFSFSDGFLAIFGIGNSTNVTIIQQIRLPRIIGAVLMGASLSISGLIMQTMSNNVMASPSTLGVTNASVLGANFAIIILGGGSIVSFGGKVNISNPYIVSLIAFIFAFLATILVLFLSRIKKFNNATTVLIGITFGTFCTGLTNLIQYFANDTSLSTAVYWAFGNLERLSYLDNLIILVVLILSLTFFLIFSYRYNAVLLGEESASTLGINLNIFRFLSLLLASLLTAVCVSFIGIIGFIGLIVPQITRRLVGNNHKHLIISSALFGSVVLLISDLLARIMLNGYALPVGAVTSILGAPIFITLLLLGKGKKNDIH